MFKLEHQEFLKQFATPEHYSVEQAPLAHPDAKEEHLMPLMNHNKWRVRAAALKHPNATKEMLEKGLNDTHQYVRETSSKQLIDRFGINV